MHPVDTIKVMQQASLKSITAVEAATKIFAQVGSYCLPSIILHLNPLLSVLFIICFIEQRAV